MSSRRRVRRAERRAATVRCVVKELMEEGLSGARLLRAVQRLTGLPEHHAQQLIAIETGKSKGDVVPAPAEWDWGKKPSKLE